MNTINKLCIKEKNLKYKFNNIKLIALLLLRRIILFEYILFEINIE